MFQHGMGAKAAFITYGGMYKDDKSECKYLARVVLS